MRLVSKAICFSSRSMKLSFLKLSIDKVFSLLLLVNIINSTKLFTIHKVLLVMGVDQHKVNEFTLCDVFVYILSNFCLIKVYLCVCFRIIHSSMHTCILCTSAILRLSFEFPRNRI